MAARAARADARPPSQRLRLPPVCLRLGKEGWRLQAPWDPCSGSGFCCHFFPLPFLSLLSLRCSEADPHFHSSKGSLLTVCQVFRPGNPRSGGSRWCHLPLERKAHGDVSLLRETPSWAVGSHGCLSAASCLQPEHRSSFLRN